MFKLEKSHWQGEGYYYLSKEDSDLYDKHKDIDDENSRLICKMIVEKAENSYRHHCSMKY